MSETPLDEPTWRAAQIWKDYKPTELVELVTLARRVGVGRVFVKLEGQRPLGNFKVLGGMVAGLRALARAVGAASMGELDSNAALLGALPRLICASDGNHGLSVAAAARRARARSSIFLPSSVSPLRARKIEELGGEIVWIAGTYDDAVHAAAVAAARGEGLLIPDTTSDLNDKVVKEVMAGYALLTHELVAQFRDEVGDRPSHIFIQAGVGGLAAAMADGLADILREPRVLCVIEPKAAPCVARALACGFPVRVPGDLHTSADMLSCGVASAPALRILQRHGARSAVVGEDLLRSAVAVLRETGGPESTPSGAAGLAGLLHVAANPDLRAEHQLGPASSVLLVATEGAASEDSRDSVRTRHDGLGDQGPA